MDELNDLMARANRNDASAIEQLRALFAGTKLGVRVDGWKTTAYGSETDAYLMAGNQVLCRTHLMAFLKGNGWAISSYNTKSKFGPRVFNAKEVDLTRAAARKTAEMLAHEDLFAEFAKAKDAFFTAQAIRDAKAADAQRAELAAAVELLQAQLEAAVTALCDRDRTIEASVKAGA